jgi:hypothetical protein
MKFDETPPRVRSGWAFSIREVFPPNHSMLCHLQNQSFLIFVWSRYRALSVQSCVKKKKGRVFVYPPTIQPSVSTPPFPESTRVLVRSSSNTSPTLFKAAEEKVLRGCDHHRSYEAGITKHFPERAFKPHLIHHWDRKRKSHNRRS